MDAELDALLADDKLEEAIAVLNAKVRARPTDTDLRAELVELLCLSGNLERADTLLDSISSLDPSIAVGVALIRHLVRAEQARKQFYAEGRAPELLAKPDPVIERELRAAVALRTGAAHEAAALLEERDASRQPAAGSADGAPFDDFRDLDDLSAGHLEVLTSNGKYFWAPIANVQSIELRKPERRRDLLWPRAHLSIAGGPDGEVFLPAIYEAPGSTATHRLGHATDFAGGDGGPTIGLGLRSFLVGDESRTILELGRIEFAAASPVA